MIESPKQGSPNDVLAEKIAEELAEAGLISKGHRSEIESRLKDGRATQVNWKTWVVAAIGPETNKETDREQANNQG